MDSEEYLKSILSSQELKEDSDELKELRDRKKDVEDILKSVFSESSPSIRYGGSYIKRTLNKSNYDLDVICYFPQDDTGAGDTLEEIYNSVKDALSENYYIEEKTSALRLRSKDENRINFHIDVVPGRFVDGSEGDAFLYQSNGEKKWLKTNLDKHIEHIRDSGHVDAIRLAKLWKDNHGLTVKTFALELLVIKLLEGVKKDTSLDKKMLKFWTELKENDGNISIEDPANSQGNDLTPIMNESILASLSSIAAHTLDMIKLSGWETVYGGIQKMVPQEKISVIKHAVSDVRNFPKPHCII